MFFRVMLISVLLLVVALLVASLPPINDMLAKKKSFEFRLDNLILFTIAVLSFVALAIGMMMDKRSLKKRIRDHEIIIADLKAKLQVKTAAVPPAAVNEASNT